MKKVSINKSKSNQFLERVANKIVSNKKLSLKTGKFHSYKLIDDWAKGK